METTEEAPSLPLMRPAAVESNETFSFYRPAKVHLDTVGKNRKIPPVGLTAGNVDSGVRSSPDPTEVRASIEEPAAVDNDETLVASEIHPMETAVQPVPEQETKKTDERALPIAAEHGLHHDEANAEVPTASPIPECLAPRGTGVRKMRAESRSVAHKRRAGDRFSRASYLSFENIGDIIGQSLRQHELQTQKERNLYHSKLSQATQELCRLEEENSELFQLVQGLDQKVSKQAASQEQLNQYRERLIKLQKFMKGVSGDMDYLKHGRSQLDNTVKELKTDIEQLKGNGRQAQASVKQATSRLEKVTLDRQTMLESVQRISDLERELTSEMARKRGIEHQLDVKSAELIEERNSKVRLEHQLQKQLSTNADLAGSLKSMEAKYRRMTEVDDAMMTALRAENKALVDERDDLRAKQREMKEQCASRQSHYAISHTDAGVQTVEFHNGQQTPGIATQQDSLGLMNDVQNPFNIDDLVDFSPDLPARGSQHLSGRADAFSRTQLETAGSEDEYPAMIEEPDNAVASQQKPGTSSSSISSGTHRPATNHQANMKTKISRGEDSVHAEHTQPLNSPFGTPPGQTRVSQQDSGAAPRSASSSAHSPPRRPRRKRSRRDIDEGHLANSPSKGPQLAYQVSSKKPKNSAPTQADMEAFMRRMTSGR